MKLGILLTQEQRLLSVSAMLDFFETVNRFYLQENLQPYFDITMLHMEEVAQTYSEYNLRQPDSDTVYDILLIPAFKQDIIPRSVSLNVHWIGWLRDQY